MSFFPFFKDIEGVKGLIAGGGRVALRKAEKLLPYSPRLTVIAPEILPEFDQLNVTLVERAFLDADLTPDLAFVIAACDDEAQNRRISLLCREMNIPVNVVDVPELCTFLFPSLVKRGKLSIGISTSGASPSAAIWLRKEIEQLLPDQMEQILDWLQEQRAVVKEKVDDEAERSRRLKQLFVQCLQNDGPPDNTGMGCVSLVGAGCGSKEWMTLEGFKLLRSCDAVVYDDLIDMALLDEVPVYADRIYVGKRSHKPSAKQEDIKKLLADLARQNKRVVRLKGGDPFVFGRGGEEIQYLNQYEIPWKVVPGISSALAIPAEAGIPVTHRGVSRSIHIMTAHTKEDVLRKDLEQFADLEGTLIFLMGLESLAEIVTILREKGRDKNTPAAVLSGGNTTHRCKVVGTLENIVQKARDAKAVTPAVIVIGNVVALDLYNSAGLPLSDVKIGLTGTDDFQEKLRSRLLPLGAEPASMMQGKCTETAVTVPWVEITDPADKWIVFTSVQGIRMFFQRCRREGIDHRRFASCKFAVIGPATKRELEKYGFMADICPQEYTSLALAEDLLSQIKKEERIYLFSSKQGTDLLTEKLTEAGLECHRFDIYDTHFTCRNHLIENPDYVLFGSAGGVRALYQSGYRMCGGAKGVCIGPVCAEAYRECFQEEPVIAKRAAVEALVEALLENTKKEVDDI